MERRAAAGNGEEEEKEMIQVPHTYAEWAVVLDMFRNREDDEAVLAVMKQGTIEWQSGVAERFAKRLIDAVNVRMNAASDKFQKDMRRSQGKERAIVRGLLALRKEMAFLAKAIDLPALPEKDRQHYLQLVKGQADSMQKSLEDSAKSDRSGKMGSIVRNHRVNGF